MRFVTWTRRATALAALAAQTCATRPAYAQPPADSAVIAAVVRKLTAKPDTVRDTLVVTHTDTLFLPTPPPVPVPVPVPVPPPIVVPPVVPPPAPVPIPPSKPPNALLARYVTIGVANALKRWAAEGANQGLADYYDRAHIFTVFGTRPEFPDSLRSWFFARADSLAVNYRDTYLVVHNYGAAPHNSQLEGVLEHFRRTGDTLSRRALLKTADVLWGANVVNSGGRYVSRVNGEGRIIARVLHGQLFAWEVAPDTAEWVLNPKGAHIVTVNSKATYAQRIDSIVTLAAAWQQPDGSYPADGQVCGGQLNYMVSMLSTALIDVYDRYRADARIPGLVRRASDFMWNSQWRTDGSFNYATLSCTGVGGMSASPDLNGLMLPAYAWLWHTTGDSTYAAATDAILAGMGKANLVSSKTFNESYTSSWRVLDWR